MRLLAIGISALALGACSVGGGYSWNGSQGSYDQAGSSSYGHSSSYGNYYGHQPTGCQIDPCSTYTPPAPQPAPCYVKPCAPVYTPPPPPVYVPPAPRPPVPPCYDPCSGGSYSVSPYAYGVDQGHGAYGSGHGNAYGHGPAYSNAGYYGHNGAVRNRRRFLQFYAPNSGYSYVTGGIAQFKDDNDTKSLAAQARVGWQSDTMFGLEAEGSLGIKKDESDLVILGVPTEREDGLKHSIAAYGTLRGPSIFTNKLRFYSRVGYHATEFRQSDTALGVTTDTDTSIDGLAWGGGIELDFSENDALRLDYTDYMDGTDDSASAVSLAYLRRF